LFLSGPCRWRYSARVAAPLWIGYGSYDTRAGRKLPTIGIPGTVLPLHSPNRWTDGKRPKQCPY